MKNISPGTSRELRALAIQYGVPEFGIPYLSMIKRIRAASNNLLKTDEDILRKACTEMGFDYDHVFKKKAGKKETK